MTTTPAVVPGSLASVATAGRISIAEAFLNADHMVLVDVSPSMEERDGVEGQSRYAIACQQLAKLQGELPGKLAIAAFSNTTELCPNGQPVMHGVGTLIAEALRFALPVDGLMDIWIISDGQPQDGDEAIALARRMKSKINGIYVGPRGGEGAAFLKRLCRIRDGQASEIATVNLAATVRLMLGTAQA